MNTQHFYKIKIRTNFLLTFVLLLTLFFTNFNSYSQNKEFIIVLDAGHGGKDPGKVSTYSYKEKEIALNIVLLLGEHLEKIKNVKVIYTRKTDIFVDLWERGRIANKADADLFVSIHCNAHNSQASGAETWALGPHANSQNFEVAKAENSVILLEDNYKVNYKGFDPSSPQSVIGLTLMQEEYLDQSIQLASIVQHNFLNSLNRTDRGVKQAGFVVLHQTYMPSVLIETGFITNKDEGAYLNSKNGQEKFAESIFESILKYMEQLNINTVSGNNTSNVSSSTSTASSVSLNKNENHSSPSKEENNNVEFKVQIATGTNKLETKSYNFKGIENVERVQDGRNFKYFVGGTSNYNEIIELQKMVILKGYTSAFIVAFKNGEKVSVDEILKKS
ncbi:N-acetylmuramoyl-L-alanine amidase [Lutibacter sp.]|uniref:N-acetylmuramoyl-L-alanine amidase family protein n=1 Tax=Lutibacter sp. TaxID=1925666 RepID=UPI0027328C85|nr:N-acetylmuramoyl-L-alanine amidase [Lutibacter sp.]MDP3313981.1 N-acetylmuramoyl-L-alanine amidase [Lutibacter sp.]